MSDGRAKNGKPFVDYREYTTLREALEHIGAKEMLQRLNAYSRYRIRMRQASRDYKNKIRGKPLEDIKTYSPQSSLYR